ncbi:MAG: O-antigen ligase family protein [Deltaproteobacteria bacterium]
MLRENSSISSIQNILIFSILVLGSIVGIYLGFKGSYSLIIGAILGLIFLFLTITKPWIAIAAFFILIPLENLYVLEGGFTSTLTKLMGAYLIFIVIISGSLKYLHEVFKNKKVLWILLFGAVGLISVLVSKNTAQSFKFVVTLWLSIVLYVVFIMMIRNTKTLNMATLAILTGAVLSVLSPLVLGFGRVSGYLWQRYGGLWGDQNEFAAILLVLIPISLTLFYISKNRVLKIILAFYSVVLLIGFVLTYSRGGFTAFGVMIILGLFKLVKGQNRTKILAIAIPCLIVAFIAFYYTFADEFITRMETLRVLESPESVRAESSLARRYYYYFELSPKLFIEHPILGVGYRGFQFHNIYNQITHNTFLEVLTGTGLLGFIPFIMILFLTWKELRRVEFIAQNNENQIYLTSYANALELGFLSYLVAGLFISLDIDKMMWLSITLSAVLMNITRIQLLTLNRKPHEQMGSPYQGYVKF